MKDPMAPRLRELAQAGGRDPGRLLALREIFSEELACAPRFVEKLASMLDSFYTQGARATLVQAIATQP